MKTFSADYISNNLINYKELNTIVDLTARSDQVLFVLVCYFFLQDVYMIEGHSIIHYVKEHIFMEQILCKIKHCLSYVRAKRK